MPELEEEVLVVIRRVFSTELGFAGAVDPAHDLLRDLHVDSLNAVILAVGLEDHFRVSLSAEDTVGVTTVASLMTLVAERVRAVRAADARGDADAMGDA